MVTEHRASFLVSCAAPCGRKPRVARLSGRGNGVSVGEATRPEDLSRPGPLGVQAFC